MIQRHVRVTSLPSPENSLPEVEFKLSSCSSLQPAAQWPVSFAHGKIDCVTSLNHKQLPSASYRQDHRRRFVSGDIITCPPARTLHPAEFLQFVSTCLVDLNLCPSSDPDPLTWFPNKPEDLNLQLERVSTITTCHFPDPNNSISSLASSPCCQGLLSATYLTVTRRPRSLNNHLILRLQLLLSNAACDNHVSQASIELDFYYSICLQSKPLRTSRCLPKFDIHHRLCTNLVPVIFDPKVGFNGPLYCQLPDIDINPFRYLKKSILLLRQWPPRLSRERPLHYCTRYTA